MKIAITGGTGFIGRYLIDRMDQVGNSVRCWHRPSSDIEGFDHLRTPIEWVPGELGNKDACHALIEGCDAVVHSGLHRTGKSFRDWAGDATEFVQKNIVGTIELIEAAREAKVGRFVFVSTCAVHEKILSDRPLDETHPLWMTTHYGAYKAAVEQFVHSYGFGMGFDICAVRPTGVYGLTRKPENSKWYDMVSDIKFGDNVTCDRGGKEVHAADVATAIDLLLHADDVAGEVYSCYDRYVSQWDVAQIAKEMIGSKSRIDGGQTKPKNEIISDKIKSLGMKFGGEQLLRDTIQQIVDVV
ncbi:NAD(P)-dependent oxidoreductase [bacterium]|nr:NAD(P)-dependent oxidoreductase [bacterium]